MLRSRALECTVLTIPHTCMYDTYKAIYKLSKLKYPDERTFVPLELLSQLKNILRSDTKMAIFAHSAMPPQLKILKLALPKIFGDTLLQL